MKTTDLKLTKTELEYLYDLVLDHKEKAEYYGRKDQFIKRQNNIIDKLNIGLDSFDKPK